MKISYYSDYPNQYLGRRAAKGRKRMAVAAANVFNGLNVGARQFTFVVDVQMFQPWRHSKKKVVRLFVELKCVRSTFKNQTFDFRIHQEGEVPHFSQLKGMCITSRTKKYGTVPFSKGQSLFWFKSTLPESVSISNLHDRDERKTRPISSTIRELLLSCHRLSSKKKWQEKQHRIYKRMT